MRLLLDENMPPSLAGLLTDAGFGTRHVREIGLSNTPDFKIAEFAASTGEVIVTHDTDFGTILALSGKERPSVVLFRWQKISTQTVFDFLMLHLEELTPAISEGALARRFLLSLEELARAIYR